MAAAAHMATPSNAAIARAEKDLVRSSRCSWIYSQREKLAWVNASHRAGPPIAVYTAKNAIELTTARTNGYRKRSCLRQSLLQACAVLLRSLHLLSQTVDGASISPRSTLISEPQGTSRNRLAPRQKRSFPVIYSGS